MNKYKYISYASEKHGIASCHGFSDMFEMIFELNGAGFTPQQIADFFYLTRAAVAYHLRKMGCKFQKHGGYRISNSITGIPGVCFNTERMQYEAQIYPEKKKMYLGQYKSKFKAALARRWGELRYNYEGDSPAQQFIIKYCTDNRYPIRFIKAIFESIETDRALIIKIIKKLP